MNDETKTETVTVELNKFEAGCIIAALQHYAKLIEDNPTARFLMVLKLGEDPRVVARNAARKVDVAGCAAFGGTPYTDDEFYDTSEEEVAT